MHCLVLHYITMHRTLVIESCIVFIYAIPSDHDELDSDYYCCYYYYFIIIFIVTVTVIIIIIVVLHIILTIIIIRNM